MKIVAVIPVRGRHPLLKHTIRRLYQVNGCAVVICVGDSQDDYVVCKREKAVWVWHPNLPLGAKWNAGFMMAGQYNPDAVLFVGSSDWLHHRFMDRLLPHLQPFGMAGTLGCTFWHYDHYNRSSHALEWRGYNGGRVGETIGIGRLLERKLMDHMAWQPFDPKLDNSMDHSMMVKAKMLGAKIAAIPDADISLSISCTWWHNKHSVTTRAVVDQSRPVSPIKLEREYSELKEIFAI